MEGKYFKGKGNILMEEKYFKGKGNILEGREIF